MRGPPVVLTPTLGRPVTNIISERGAVPMTVVNTLGEPVTLVNSGGEPVTLFNENGTLWDYPFSLFSNNEQGAWYDPSDYSTLYQDATGTTPVTAVEQPVRLMLDRSKGLVLGAELVTFDLTGATGTPNVYNWRTGGTATVLTANSFSKSVAAGIIRVGFATNKYYEVSFSCSLTVSDTLELRDGLTGSDPLLVSVGTGTTFSGNYKVLITSGNLYFRFVSATTTVTFASVSVRELPGNHATAPNNASRPVLRARYNLLTYTEQFDNAIWGKVRISATANTHVAPDGTTTADTITADTAGAGVTQINQNVTFAGARTFSVYAKAGSHDFIQLLNAGDAEAFANFDINTGTIGTVGTKTTASIENAGSGWYRCSASFDATIVVNQSHRIYFVSSNTSAFGASFTSSGSDTILLWGASLLTAADQSATGGAYQRIAAATDYDTSNPVWRPYLAFDGSDDSMSTSAIDFSGTDEMTVFAGVKQQSPNTNAGQIIELSADVGLNNGAFGLAWPANTDINTLRFQVRGTTFVGVNDAAATTQTNTVISMQADISAPSIVGRRNGTQVASSSSSLGTGNFGNYPLFIGRRNNTSNPFNGRLYGLTVLGRTATAAELSAMEAWVAGKTGVTI